MISSPFHIGNQWKELVVTVRQLVEGVELRKSGCTCDLTVIFGYFCKEYFNSGREYWTFVGRDADNDSFSFNFPHSL